MDVEELAAIAVDCGLKTHQGLGPGLLESAYEAVLAHLLMERGLAVQRQVMVPIRFGDLFIDEGFRADLIVKDRLLIELKAIERLVPIHSVQVLTYIRFLNLPLGLLMNFGGATFKEGLRRVVDDHGQARYPSRTSRSSR